ncbi:hypothetical protein C8Q74DRAFT_479854 [Fomes fomentarius]|nr:hypothetical protein C8Q74DRAFT_479854 [Fomes fomentarius]
MGTSALRWASSPRDATRLHCGSALSRPVVRVFLHPPPIPLVTALDDSIGKNSTMADFVQALDPSKLVLVGTALSFATSAFVAPAYNLPIFLFGVLAQESSEAIQSLQAFTAVLAASILYDVIFLANNTQHWFIKLLNILLLILKLPTVAAFATALRQRGGSFSGLNIRGNDLSGPTGEFGTLVRPNDPELPVPVWSMPGGFTSSFGSSGRDGYQNVEDPAEGPKPLSVPPSHPAQPAPQTAPGAYQNV